MKKIATLLAITLFAFVSKSNAQSVIENINSTLENYIDGTEKGEPDRVRKAFHEDFQLYLISADTLRIISGSQYISNIEKGRKYNRKGRVVSIDYENNAAAAKVEVYFPETNRLATDYLLLLKTFDGWKILHKIINVTVKDEQDLTALPRENEIHNIEKTLLDYMEGTAKSDSDRIESAFWDGLNLYSVKDGAVSKITREKYLGFFSNDKQYRRIGKILSIDYEKDAALAKLEIKMPEHDRIAIDYMLLLKIRGSWKVIHKSFTDKDFKLNSN
ncbi:nuclear transport factor 2 family protein [Muriicola sp. Z0-33]|uniref:nuclear transport factor 2 family protein n=1 Tax=Muriicola sp. Z0-33 TaxID=2816957 RepID=UPI002237F1DF|nr:nuclear transport factor 2 family protein [Muriicola sp. Z0-33]MCW5518129.1 nuclear transport factor 2 family protein [Muriicola sp. Z0-33]